jgi:hypothetical protein
MNSTFYSHWEEYTSKQENLMILGITTAKQGTQNKFSGHIRRDKMSERHDRKAHEGKTSGSVLHGLTLAQECALLVFFPYLRYEENPGGHAGYP